MKAIVTVKRITTYSSIVEIEPEKFAKLQSELDSGDWKTRRAAEKDVNRLIDVHDWQDDELDSIEQFEEFKEP